MLSIVMHSLLVTIVLLASQVIWHPVSAGTNCTGENEYLDRNDGTCKQCEKCSPGQQPKEHCGYGDIHSGYKCESCPINTFSTRHDYNLCVVCRDCKLKNAEAARQCTSESNSICGTCFSGYFNPTKSGGSMGDECHLCTEASKEYLQCRESVGTQWQIMAIIGCGTTFLLFLVVIAFGCFMCKRGMCHLPSRTSAATVLDKENNQNNAASRSSMGENTPLAERALLSNKDEVACIPGLFLSRSRCHGSESEAEEESDQRGVPVVQDTPGKHNVEETGLTKSGLISPIQHFEVESEVPLKAEAPRTMPQFDENTSVTPYPHSNYSNQPTAEFVDPVIVTNEASPTRLYNGNSPRPPPSYSNLPTRPYDQNDALGNQNNNSTRQPLQDSGNRSYRRRGSSTSGRRRRPQVDITSSNESLLENVDRDSKVVGRQRPSPITMDFVPVEFFDTGSIDTESTKPHIVGSYTSTQFSSRSQFTRTGSPTIRPTSPTSFQCHPVNFSSNSMCQLQANIVRPRPAISSSAPNCLFLPPPSNMSNSLNHQCEPCNMNKSLSSSEIILSSHTTNIQKIKERFEKACSKVKDQPLDNLDSNLADRITLKLTDRPEGTGEAYPTIKTWRHIANCFKIESVTVDNSRSLSDILRYLRAHRRHTILDLLNAVNHIQRYDVLSDICNHILGFHAENSVNQFEECIPSMLVSQA